MEPVEGGRRCERCARRVDDTAGLSEARVHELVDEAARRQVCVRVEHRGSRPLLRGRAAAGFLVVALSGCATAGWDLESAMDAGVPAGFVEQEAEPGQISGVVRDRDGAPIAEAIVVLQSTALEGDRELMTDERGRYHFDDLPAGTYTVLALAGRANVSKLLSLADGAGARVNFTLSGEGVDVLVGVLIAPRKVPMDASSTIRASETVWID